MILPGAAPNHGEAGVPALPSSPFPVTHSLLAAGALSTEIARAYPIATPTSCTLYRAYANDVYFITTDGEPYVLKVYRASWRSAGEIAYEVTLLAHLAAKGERVSTAVPRRDGHLLGTLRAPEGARHYVLYTFAAGTKPTPPFTEDLYHRFGQATAQVHQSSDDFASSHPRSPLDLAHFLDRPLAALRPWLAERPADWRFVVLVAEKVRQHISKFGPDLDWGPCHGDLSLDNVHVTDRGDIIFYDFDSGGPGWRASDPYGVYRYARQSDTDLWPPFLQGYRAIRTFNDVELASLPYFAAAYAIEGLGHQAAHWASWNGQRLMDKTFLDRVLADLRQWDADAHL